MDLVEYDGNCAEHIMINYLKKLLLQSTEPYFLVEGKYADSYTKESDKMEIKKRYKERWDPKPNPQTYPSMYDPFDPPTGWRYDPFYEVWTKIK